MFTKHLARELIVKNMSRLGFRLIDPDDQEIGCKDIKKEIIEEDEEESDECHDEIDCWIKHVNQIYYVSALSSTILAIRGLQEKQDGENLSPSSVVSSFKASLPESQGPTLTRATSVESRAAQGLHEPLDGPNVKTIALTSEDNQPNVEGTWVDVVRAPPKTNNHGGD